MNIRAITLGLPVHSERDLTAIPAAGAFLKECRSAFEQAGYAVQTLRVTTPPALSMVGRASELAPFARSLEAVALQSGVDYAALGPVQRHGASDLTEWVQAAADAVTATSWISASVEIASAGAGVDLAAARVSAAAISDIAANTEQGFGNLRFAVQANVAPGGAFFPTAYHSGGAPSFGIALEAADLAVDAFSQGGLAEGRQRLIAAVESAVREINTVARSVERLDYRFGGVDLTLAPYPEQHKSIAYALERLGLGRFGGPGTLATVAMLADILRSVDAPRCGFSGVMLPVLEDSVLAQSWADGLLSADSLLLFSAVCGTGIDTLPLAGDVSREQLVGILVDMAALAVVLNKPLTARLLPVPGLAAGSRTRFNFAYFANSTAWKPPVAGVHGGLMREIWLQLAAR